MENSIEIKDLTKIYKIYKKPWHRVVDVFSKKKRYKPYYALKDLSISIPKGEAIGVLGKNGAGKSTLLKIITGVTSPTKGNISIDGKISALLELTSGFDSELTGIENIYLKALTIGITKKEIEKQLQVIIDFADIGEHIYQPVRTYSSGMKSRLGFAISVNVDPDILIVDEVLSVGDDVFKLKCIEKMEEFKKQGKTIFFVSHSLFTVKTFCNKCMWIKDGELISYGDTGEIMVQYENYLKEERSKEIEKKQQQALENNTQAQILSKKEILQFSNFAFLNANGEKSNKYDYMEKIIFKVDYEVKRPMNGLRWCFTIRDAETREIFGSDKKSEDNLLKEEIGKHTLKVTLEDVMLLPGKYLLSGEVTNATGAMFMSYSNKKPFYINLNKFCGTGIQYIKHSYENKSI
ncbi:ATP-binding cassette domain-containing protein [Alkalibaculum sp. M08DMB]|uniref:ATP-binding cassette domain-containing protein n=1 Tax=Alkalibaculum sporogenes TaxID=2655001 RepID=A0A6A7KCD2_9FIRM|nr:ABC transporter ATP-binding protein [Alkalibaculum sporogenes]MPW27190.1 ATP-binding cassette domain-containing protein [Alkalibaculum sporogenes]